ncbi:CLUMA_CG009253, isoform A [Clunio marinus]|uniref:CLUMA_CG009253, isoform A n=1 Tax=Clunio marinus TaxID=568069 RepID=A0A1J1I898_9DIPT|nr:CLUMA_CG009253, isoform A [Clunio marinus]
MKTAINKKCKYLTVFIRINLFSDSAPNFVTANIQQKLKLSETCDFNLDLENYVSDKVQSE